MHLVSLLAAAAAWQVAAVTLCPGAIDIGGHGAVILANAKFDTPGVASRGADVVGRSAVEPNLAGRTYFANDCLNGNYSNTQYAAFQLLGKRLRYTTDIAGAACGCNAGLSLVPMRENKHASQCLDHYCDAGSLCGVACSEINIQEANRHAWHSTLHSASDARGLSMGFGGDGAESGPRNFNASEYGPGARCVDTSRPFQVAASFPVDVHGALESMEVELSQEGQPCAISMGIMGSARVMSELSDRLTRGLTPVISYWGSHDLQWLDGQGQDGKGPCALDTPFDCTDSVRFYDFVVEPIREGPPPGDGPAAALAAAAASGEGQGQEKPCIDGWQQHPECVAAFTYEGTTFEACTSTDYRQPWCSHDAAYAGVRLLCDACGSPTAPVPIRAEAPNVATSSTPQPARESTGAAPACQWAVYFDRTVPQTWDSFTLVEQGKGLSAIKTVHGKYLAVEVDGSVRADFDQVAQDGIFVIERYGRPDGPATILTSSGQYLSAGADGALVARSRRPEDKDRFVMVEREDGTISIRSADFKYLISEESCMPACASGESSYLPLDMPGQGPGWAMDASGCQALCTTMPSCMHFTFFAAGKTCHVADGGSRLQVGTVGAVAGPAACVRLPMPRVSVLNSAVMASCEFPIRFDRQASSGWDFFRWIDQGSGKVSLVTYHGMYVGATAEGSIRADFTPQNGTFLSEVFDVAWLTPDTFGLKAVSGKFVSAGQDGTLQAQSTAVGMEEIFTRVLDGDGIVSLLAWNGRSLVAEKLCTPQCAMADSSYHHSTSLGLSAGFARDAAACQLLCAADARCAHFSYVSSDSGCHLADSSAGLQVSALGSVAGPPQWQGTPTSPPPRLAATSTFPSPAAPTASSEVDRNGSVGAIPQSDGPCDYPLRFDRHLASSGWDVFDWIPRGEGKVALRTAHGKYVGVGDDGSFRADLAELPGEEGLLRIVKNPGGSLSFTTYQGKLVTAAPSGQLSAHATNAVGERERFQLVPHSNGKVSLQAWTRRNIVAERFCAPPCAVAHVYYHPLDAAELPQTWATDASQCQSHCAAQPGCAHFTWFSADGGCHLAASSAQKRRSPLKAVAGPALCGENPVANDAMPARGFAGATAGVLAAPGAAETSLAAEEACQFPLRFTRQVVSGQDRFEWIVQNGGRVSLLTLHGRYVGVLPDGSVRAEWLAAGARQMFEVVGHSGGSFSLRSYQGKFLTAEAGGILLANATGSAGEPGNFRLVPYDDGTVTLEAWTQMGLVAEMLCAPSCAAADAYYHPLDSAGLPRTWESDAAHCQWRCAAQPGCAHFSFFKEDGSCHLSVGGGELRGSNSGAVAGPAKCGGGAAAIGSVEQAASALMLVSTSTTVTTTTGGFLAKATATKEPQVGTRTAEWAGGNDQVLAWRAKEVTECEWPLRFSSPGPSGWGRFRWIDMGYGAIALQAWHGRYVGVAQDGSLKARFRKLRRDTTSFDVAWWQDGSFSLSALNGVFVAAAPDGPLTSTSMSERAIFRRISHGDGTFTLRTSTNGSLVAEKACTPICAERHASYDPLDMPGRGPTRGGDAASCQAQCAALPGCAHFTFTSADRSCHLAGSSARMSRGRAGAIAGPPRCDEVVIMDEVPAIAPAPPLGRQRSWAVVAFLGCVAVPALLALARRASASGTVRSFSFSELLPQDDAEDDEPPTDNEEGQDRNVE